VIVRLRGRSDLGTTFMDVLRRYAGLLQAAGSKLVLVSTNPEIGEQLRAAGLTATLGPGDIYPGDERIGAALERAYTDAEAWVEERRTERREG
jgi:SulP family sulfate permease